MLRLTTSGLKGYDLDLELGPRTMVTGGKAPLTITVHVDRPCTECGSKGTTTDSGFCLDCIGKKMRDPLFRKAARRHAERAEG